MFKCTKEEFYLAALGLDLFIKKKLGINEKTYRRWKQNGAPVAVHKWLTTRREYKILQRDAANNLGILRDDWEGWSLTGDKLYSPEGYSYSQGDIRSWFYRLQLIDTLTVNNKHLKTELDAIRNPPAPDEPEDKIILFSAYHKKH